MHFGSQRIWVPTSMEGHCSAIGGNRVHASNLLPSKGEEDRQKATVFPLTSLPGPLLEAGAHSGKILPVNESF